MPNLAVHLRAFKGDVSAFTLELIHPTTGALGNAGGDELTESANGVFLTEVEEDLSDVYAVDILRNGFSVAQGWVNMDSVNDPILVSDPRDFPTLVQAGTGVGQLSLAAGVVGADVRKIAGSTSAAQIEALFWNSQPSGTAQGGDADSITLAVGASSDTNYYKKMAVLIMAGTGQGQVRQITAYNGTTKVATVEVDWVTVPDETSVYLLIGRIV